MLRALVDGLRSLRLQLHLRTRFLRLRAPLALARLKQAVLLGVVADKIKEWDRVLCSSKVHRLQDLERVCGSSQQHGRMMDGGLWQHITRPVLV